MTIHYFPERERYLTTEQLASALGYSTRWVSEQNRRGMPRRKIGGHNRYLLSEVLAWFEEKAA